jgi:hypothetical protein
VPLRTRSDDLHHEELPREETSATIDGVTCAAVKAAEQADEADGRLRARSLSAYRWTMQGRPAPTLQFWLRREPAFGRRCDVAGTDRGTMVASSVLPVWALQPVAPDSFISGSAPTSSLGWLITRTRSAKGNGRPHGQGQRNDPALLRSGHPPSRGDIAGAVADSASTVGAGPVRRSRCPTCRFS